MLDGERLEVGRDWFASAVLSDTERCQILGMHPAEQTAKHDSFNFISTFLHYQVGLHEDEIPEWFRCSMNEYLDGQRPLDAWQQEDGFEQVYEAAEAWRKQMIEDLGDEAEPREGITMDPTPAERQSMQQALDIFRDGFAHCGIELDAEDNSLREAGVWNGNEEAPFFMHFQRSNGRLEGYKIGMRDGASTKRLCLLTWQDTGSTRQIVRATLGESVDGAPDGDSYQSDLDPFPKRADAEPFIRRLEECVATETLVSTNIEAKV
jgi:hypothetical protein